MHLEVGKRNTVVFCAGRKEKEISAKPVGPVKKKKKEPPLRGYAILPSNLLRRKKGASPYRPRKVEALCI